MKQTKRLISMLLVMFIFLSAQASTVPGPVGPYTAGVLVNPAINTILADSGPLVAAGRTPCFTVTSTVAAVVVFEWRDAANTANVYSHIYPIAAMTPYSYCTQIAFDAIVDNERYRVRLNAAVTGSIQVTLTL